MDIQFMLMKLREGTTDPSVQPLVADAYERLEAALRKIIDRAEYRMSSKVINDVVAIARDALQPER